jgi:PEP-CTERM motif
MPMLTRAGRVTAMLVVLGAAVLQATIITIPPDLKPGDTYRLVFVTSTVRDATSTDIDIYNQFVSGAANSVAALKALGATWKAIGSTAAVDAATNIGASPAPIYRLDGNLVAAGTADLWDGFIRVSISLTEHGDPPPIFVSWTGSTGNGGSHPNFPLGGDDLMRVNLGSIFHPGMNLWISAVPDSGSNLRPLYGISSVITVPSAVPEPSSLALLAVGTILLMVRRSLRGLLRLRT